MFAKLYTADEPSKTYQVTVLDMANLAAVMQSCLL